MYACECSIVKLLDLVATSDFVATARILNVTPDPTDKDFHDLEIELIDLYKGEPVTKLKLNSVLNSSCAFWTPENTTWLIYATKDKNGNLSFGECSGSRIVKPVFDKQKYPFAEINYQCSIERELEVLAYLKKEGISPARNTLINDSYLGACFTVLRGIDLQQDHFALYSITVESQKGITGIKPLKAFNNQLLRDGVMKCLTENAKISERVNLANLPEKSEVVLAFYYYPAERGNPSFISTFDL